MDIKLIDNCKLCTKKMLGGCFYFPNKDGICDICSDCGSYMKYLDNDLVKDKIKFIRKIRCHNCNYRICKINDKEICLWCLNDDIILRHKILYNKYKGKTHAFVLQNDFDYCINQIQYRNEHHFDESKLTHLTNKILNKVSHGNRYSDEHTTINKRWM